jgi:hypothetical protein
MGAPPIYKYENHFHVMALDTISQYKKSPKQTHWPVNLHADVPLGHHRSAY